MKQKTQVKVSSKQKTLIYVLLLIIITAAVFSITVIARKPYFGYLSLDSHQWLTGSTVKFLKNWWNEGAINLKFVMLENPKSIEFPDINSRTIYASYPPGTLLPIYLICKIINIEPNADLVMGYNLSNHFLIAIFLSLTCFIFLRKIKLSHFYSFLFSIIPILIELLLPGPLYWHQNVFFSDQAVILPFALLVFSEVLKDNISNKKIVLIIKIFQGILIFFGILTDWLFVFITIILYFKRIFNKELGKNIKEFLKGSFFFWLPVLISIILYAAQITYFKMWPKVLEMFLFRSAISENGKQYVLNFFKRFWFLWSKGQYGIIGVILLWITILILIASIILLTYKAIKHRKNEDIVIKFTNLSAILIIPCLIQIYLFRNHSFIHSFSALKLSLALSLLPLAIIPGIILSLLANKNINSNNRINPVNQNNKTKIIVTKILIIIFLSFSIFYVVKDYKIANPSPEKSFKTYGEFISANSSYEDVFFSNNYEVPDNPPEKLSFSMKRVYKILSVLDIYPKIKNIKGEPNIVLFVPNVKEDYLSYDLKVAIEKSYSQIINNNMGIFKIKKSDFLKIYATSKDIFDSLLNNKDYDKFINITKNITNEKYITMLYNYLLRRPPDNDGFINWINLLDSGMPRQKVLNSFLNSEEFNRINQ